MWTSRCQGLNFVGICRKANYQQLSFHFGPVDVKNEDDAHFLQEHRSNWIVQEATILGVRTVTTRRKATTNELKMDSKS